MGVLDLWKHLLVGVAATQFTLRGLASEPGGASIGVDASMWIHQLAPQLAQQFPEVYLEDKEAFFVLIAVRMASRVSRMCSAGCIVHLGFDGPAMASKGFAAAERAAQLAKSQSELHAVNQLLLRDPNCPLLGLTAGRRPTPGRGTRRAAAAAHVHVSG